MALYVMRHGVTDMNLEHRMQGRADIELNEKGKSQAALMGEIFKLKGIKFDVVYTSPLIRAVQTAQIVSGVDCHDIIEVPDLMEMDFGNYELSVINELPFEIYDPIFARPGVNPVPETVEPHQAVVDRAWNCLSDIRKKHGLEIANENRNILVLTHGGVVLSMVLAINKKPIIDFWKGAKMHNCGTFELILDPEDFSGSSDRAICFFQGF